MKEDNRCLVVEAFTHFHAKFYAADVIPPLPSPFLPKQSAVLFHVSRGLFLESPETSGATRERYQLVLYFWWFQRRRLK